MLLPDMRVRTGLACYGIGQISLLGKPVHHGIPKPATLSLHPNRDSLLGNQMGAESRIELEREGL